MKFKTLFFISIILTTFICAQQSDVTNKNSLHFDFESDSIYLRIGESANVTIKILDHNIICKKLPDYFLVLPWHFKNNILKKDIHILKKGVKYIFPFPNIRIYTYRKNMVTSSKL